MEHVEVKGARVPAIGLGTWRLDGRECYDAVAHGLAIGYRHIDTARAYGNEAEVGRGLADSAVGRDDVWLTTKVPVDKAAPAEVRPSVEASLRDLRTDHVDLLLIHWPPRRVPVTATVAAMAELAEAGLTRYVGVSNFPTALVRDAIGVADILTNQVEYHPYLAQDAVLAEAERDGHMVTAYSPLAKGKVVGSGRGGEPDPVIREIAAAHGKTPAQVTLRWLIQQPRVSAIPRSSSDRRRSENLDVFDFALTHEEMAALSGLARPDGRLIDPPFAPEWD